SSACSLPLATSKPAAKRSSSSAPNKRACTGPPGEQPTSSPCAPSTPAADGTNYGPPKPPAQPASRRPSDRPGNSDPLATATSKIIPNKADVHPAGGHRAVIVGRVSYAGWPGADCGCRVGCRG